MNYYQQPFPPFQPGIPYPFQPNYPNDVQQDELASEQSYIENILRDNLNKVATVYMNFENSQWGSKIFKGVLKGAGKDHIILKDIQSETRYVLLMVYLNYITFDERIEYDYPYRKKEE
ncbi:MAG: spore coat protein GerQ [Coprobacillus sp.]|nr:spore coat protein GerQ [Coprobacillus sp.]OLA10480.1 MAG: spore coat protein GerQ [Coprobacillus sp. 28_7]CCY07403.1 spore coat and germination protein GerQ [Coprobacillus sp. CAG:698]